MHNAKIVVVEDESIVAMEIKDRLQGLGYKVTGIFSTGEEAVARMEELQPDLVLMDIMLKGKMDGIAAAQKIREQYDIPAIYLTAYSDESTLQRAKITEPFGYLLKPFEERELHTAIEMALYKFKTEKELIENKRWLSTTLKSIGDAVIATDQAGKIKFMNPIAEELTGWKQKEAIGRDSGEVFHIMNEKTREPAENPVGRVLREGKIVGLANHTVLITRQGKEIPIDDSAAPIQDDHGNVLGVVLDFRDVSSRKETEKILRDSEIKFKSVVQSSNDAIIITDFSGRIVTYNRAAAKMFGYQEEELINRPLSFLIPKNRLPQHSSRKTISTGKMDLCGSTVELEGLRKDRNKFPIELSLASWKTHEGSFLSYNIRDITERKKAEEAIKRERDFVAAILDMAGMLVVVLDHQGNLVRANKFWAKVTGYERETVYGQKYLSLLQTDTEVETYKNQVAKIFQGSRQCEFECSMFTVTGERRTILWNFVSLYDRSGLLDYVIGTGLDITDLRNLEHQLRQSQKMEAVGKLAGGIAHDFNNLLTAINGYSDLILDTMDPEDSFYEDVREIRQAGLQAASLTHQLLAFSRRQMLDMKIVNLNEVIANVDRMLRRIIGENIKLITLKGEDLYPVKVDTGQIEQIILNLSINAKDAMPRGGNLTIETKNVSLDEDYCKTHQAVTPGEYVMLAVSDNGCGMTGEIKERIFEPFFTTKEPGKGTGLGLSTVYGIVKQCNGFIWVYSEPGEGSTFKIYFPRAEEEPSYRQKLTVDEDYPQGSECILLAEDEKVVRDFATRILTQQGYKILAARDGEEALKLAENHQGRFNMLLTDVVMPHVSGKELAERLLARNKELKILFMSGYTDQAIVHQGVLEEGIEFLQKPFSPALLIHKVREVLDR